MDYQRWLQQAIARLQDSDSPRRDAEILLGFATGKARTFIMAFGETMLSEAEQRQLSQLLERRVAGEPVAYLTGQKEFWSLQLTVSPATLIPRPDTECLVEHALSYLPAEPADILDLGTGTGAIALAIASERPDCRVQGVDIQLEAVTLAKENAQRLGISNAYFTQGSWFSRVEGQRFILIVSNPPYIDAEDIHLSQGDVRFEPSGALISGEEGLADLRVIITESPQYLLPGGGLLLEHGWQQGAAVRSMLEQRGFIRVKTHKDYGSNERVSLGFWPE
ncbi:MULTISPECIES: peptide chain release factor N(5)-glutamine methyltransferase [Lonsdalea]|uniref:Protein-(Glutamine-N5) methyltransferase, release factor-specific n=2 Tax=Lonsdalea TaxID=1082702 RepID=A0ACD1JDS7_9GAMM|nr:MULTISPECIES: peptide chain release factor N(5)-glutamine methyltransferase [Lonsdalea]OSM99643.1 protein-(glutamine-N5) methyltransferase, release factor-specific [Lonsdalea populi]OSN02578.1 protein-(glutamine-N5) methyltransferase, release factor-specific [Lonsdalea populi]QPQ25664.1 peptide chain release factor N(5)-glutamine methyltransferase [Lonsdalea populi]RAT14500.1 protein-(glutamine-N5) methyltransferase, release factor-specific [Lonsdalea quercina]RAT17018.1 protein-(glutamine-